MANKKLRFRVSRGYNGAIIRAGAVVEISDFWANIFLNDGTAEELKEKSETKPTEPKKGKNKNAKS